MIRSGVVLWTILSLFLTLLSACDSSDPLSGVPSGLVIEVQPGAPAPSGAAFSVQPAVRLVDHKGKPVLEEGHQILVHFADSPDAAAWLSHASAMTDSLGMASFRALAISGDVGSYRLEFSGEGLFPSVSDQVVVSGPIQGLVEDPEGDMPRSGADLRSARLEVVGGDSLLLSVRWVTGGYVQDTSIANVFLDTDSDVGTGHPGINSTGSVDEEFIGADYLISVGLLHGDWAARLYQPSHTTESGVNIYGEVPLSCLLTNDSDGFDLVIPLAVFGEDEDGVMNYKLNSVVKVSENEYSGWLDVAPDVGKPAVQVRSAGS
jgi:hypothetical protein